MLSPEPIVQTFLMETVTAVQPSYHICIGQCCQTNCAKMEIILASRRSLKNSDILPYVFCWKGGRVLHLAPFAESPIDELLVSNQLIKMLESLGWIEKGSLKCLLAGNVTHNTVFGKLLAVL